METFGRREFIKVVDRSAAGLLFGFSQMQGCTKREGLLETPEKVADPAFKTEVADVHCHLFNAQYTIEEYVAARWNCC